MDTRKLIIFSGPSGSGKTTIVRHLLKIYPDRLGFSISATTRKKRGSEESGKDYYYLSHEEFKNRIQKDEFLEWEEVYSGRYYGTLKSEVVRLWQSGKAVLFDLDVVGGLAIKRQFPEQTLAIFVQPPNLETLIERLKNRKTEDQIALNKRIDKAPAEMAQAKFFDAILINDDLEQAFEKASSLVSNFLNSD